MSRTRSRPLQGSTRASSVTPSAKVAELVDAPDLGSGGFDRGGSTPPFRNSSGSGGGGRPSAASAFASALSPYQSVRLGRLGSPAATSGHPALAGPTGPVVEPRRGRLQE